MEIRGSVPPDPAPATAGRPAADGLSAPPPGEGPGRPGAAPSYGTRASMPYEGVWRFTAPSVESSVPRVRRGVRDLLSRRGVPVHGDILYGLLLITSELVTNAVKHAAVLSPEIGVEVCVGAAWVRIAVEDNHPYRPKALVTDEENTGGRGLLLVKTVTREAGGSCDVQHTAAGGKVVWAALPLAPAGG